MLGNMSEIPSTEPTEITAGDTIRWSKSLSDYPADAFALHYALTPISGGTPITVDASADGTDHAITISAATSAGYTSGVYRWASYVIEAATSERTTLERGQLNIYPDPTTSSADTRSTVKQIYDAINATILGEASNSQLKVVIDGDSLETKSTADLLALESRFRNLLRQEEDAEKLNKGLHTGSRIQVRMLD